MKESTHYDNISACRQVPVELEKKNEDFERMCKLNNISTRHDQRIAAIAWEAALGGILT